MTETPATLTYTYLFSRYSVRIYLNISALNGLDILSCDIQNTYLNADFREAICDHTGQEFGSKAGPIMILRKTLYGLKFSGAVFCAHLAETLHAIGFLSTEADPDVCYLNAVKPNDFEYYEYVLCYVYNILCISHDLDIELGQIQAIFKFKRDKIEQPKIYLGDKVRNMI